MSIVNGTETDKRKLKARSVEQRVMGKFLVGDGCWDWQAGKNHGYGWISTKRGGNPDRAHRVLYRMLVGPIPEGMDLDHLCRNRGCVRPDHLEPVTRSENIRRGWQHKKDNPCPHCNGTGRSVA